MPSNINNRGLTRTRLYKIWGAMKTRCYNPNYRKYYRYGGRGIKICDEWLNSFVSFSDWSMRNGYYDNLTIDRINVNGNYEPSNCRWITVTANNRNKTNNHYIKFRGKTQTIADWAEELDMNDKTIATRIYRGWSIEKALTTPLLHPPRRFKKQHNQVCA